MHGVVVKAVKGNLSSAAELTLKSYHQPAEINKTPNNSSRNFSLG